MTLVNLAEMKFYIYRSKAKIEMLHSQLAQAKKKKVKWKVNFYALSRESETDSSEGNLEEKLQSVLAELEEQELIGSIEDGKPYIKGILPMQWGLYNDNGIRAPNTGPMVYFGSTDEQLLFGMGGSSHHIEGYYGITSTSSRSATASLAAFLTCGLETGERPPSYRDVDRSQMDLIYEGMALANHYLKGPVQELEFVAKVICRDKHCKLRPWRDERGEGILATPLYVSQVHPRIEDDDYPAES